MNGDVCLSGRDIECYLGEEESRVHALRGVSLDVEFGSTHAVVGPPSGCGKSTLGYVLGLLDHADSGSVTIASEHVSDLPDEEWARRRNELIGFIFQFHFLMEETEHNHPLQMRKKLSM